jgi:hypothetical protein
MKKISLISVFVFIKMNAFGSEWIELTPFGGQISYSGYYNEGKVYYLRENGDTLNRVQEVTKWYFYKGCTIGKNNTADSCFNFFIGDESNHQLYLFKSQTTFMKFITNRKLNPYILRWHSDTWSNNPLFYVNDQDFLIGAILWVIIIPFTLFLFLISGVIYWYKYKENPLKNKIVITVLKILFIVIPIIYTINYLLNEFPQSI